MGLIPVSRYGFLSGLDFARRLSSNCRSCHHNKIVLSSKHVVLITLYRVSQSIFNASILKHIKSLYLPRVYLRKQTILVSI